jgi:hypothetical protein
MADRVPPKPRRVKGARTSVDAREDPRYTSAVSKLEKGSTEWAHQQVIVTARAIEDIAADCGCSALALERRLERHYGARSRELRGGSSGRGRPGTGDPRERWSVRLTADERAEVDAAVARERTAGATSDGEALAQAVRGGTERRTAKPQRKQRGK